MPTTIKKKAGIVCKWKVSESCVALSPVLNPVLLWYISYFKWLHFNSEVMFCYLFFWRGFKKSFLVIEITFGFSPQLKIKQAGVNIQKFVPGLQINGTRLDEYFSIIHPQVTFAISSMKKFINSQFVLKIRREIMPNSLKKRPALKLRGTNFLWTSEI